MYFRVLCSDEEQKNHPVCRYRGDDGPGELYKFWMLLM